MRLENEDMVLRRGLANQMARGRSRVENSLAVGLVEGGCELNLSCGSREISC